MRRLPAIALSILLLSALAPVAARGRPPGCNWPMYGRDAGRRFAQAAGCSEISPANVSTLKPKWFVPTEDSVTASPSVVDGILYVGSWDGTFYAVDAETGHVLWTFTVDDTHETSFGRIVSSAAVGTLAVEGAVGKVRAVLFGGGGTLYALEHRRDRARLLAKVDIDPRPVRPAPEDDEAEVEILSSPVVGHFAGGDDRIFVGMDVHNDAGVGRTGVLSFKLARNPRSREPYRFRLVYKFDPETGRVLHDLTSPTRDAGFGCGGVWSSPALDPTALGPGDGLLFFGTANCDNVEESVAAGEVGREGIFAIEAKSGEPRWKFHPRRPNHVDDDFGASANLLPGGLVGEGGKDGWYYAFHRVSGREAWRTHVAQAGHVQNGFAIGGIIGTPAVGEVAGEPAIFATAAIPTPIGEPLDGGPDVDESLAEDPGRLLSLHAISAVDGEILWRSPLARTSYGAPTYANGVVFIPSGFDFSVKAFHADTGLLLWEHPLNGSPSSAPAIVGDSIYLGAGTRDTDLEFKAFGAGALEALVGAHPHSRLSGIWAFELAESSFAPSEGVLFSAHGNQLDAYDLDVPAPATTRRTVVPRAAAGGNDVNGQICRVTQRDGSVRYVMGEDTNQSSLPRGSQGWGLFDPTTPGKWTMRDKLVPTYNFTDPKNDHLPDNTGCAFSAGRRRSDPRDDMLFAVDLGNAAFDAPGVGSLFVFYRDHGGDFSSDSRFCVLDNHLTTAGYIALDEDGSVLVPENARSSGGVISRFSPPFPERAAGCSPYPLSRRKRTFIHDPVASFLPLSIAKRDGKWLVGNVQPGMVSEYDAGGAFVRVVVPPGHYNVAGMAVDAAGNLYFANLGLRPDPIDLFTPQDGAGSLHKVSFAPVTDAPLPPVLAQPGLDFPEGMGIFPSVVP